MGVLNLYDTDFYAWTQEQATLIKNKEFNKLDIENLFEEIESMGKHEKRELTSRLKVLLIHLLKWKYQPTKRTTSWELTIKEQRRELKSHLEENPSLKNVETFNERLTDAYDIAILKAANETGLSENAFPHHCEWSLDQILSSEFYPN